MTIDLKRWLLTRLVRRYGEPNVIMSRDGTSPYLSRWYPLGQRDDDKNAAVKAPERPFNLFIHRFHRSDEDGALHSHPWLWAVSLILVGGYEEEYRVGDRVERRTVRPGDINVLTGEDFHRVDLLEHDCWTLFIAGPKLPSGWAFWDRETKLRAIWHSFIAERRGEIPVADWQPDSRSSAN